MEACGVEKKGKKCVDWFLCREKILLPILYPYYEGTQQAHPGKKVWLVKDNAALHRKAAEVCEKDGLERGILKAPWPSGSPDLNCIENAWCYEKDMLAVYEPEGSGKSDKEELKTAIHYE